MIYLQKHTNRSWTSKIWSKIGYVIIIIATIFVLSNSSQALHRVVTNMLAPLFEVGGFFYDNFFYLPKFFTDKNALIEQNNKLSAEIEKLQSGLIDVKLIKFENDELKSALRINKNSNFIVASVVSRAPQITMDTVFLDKGDNENIKVNDLVLLSERLLVGKIINTSSHQSTVLLNSFAGTKSFGLIERTGEMVELLGQGGGAMRTTVPIDFDILIGDEVITEGVPAYLIAVVSSTVEDKVSGFKEVFFSYPIKVSKVRMLFIKSMFNQ